MPLMWGFLSFLGITGSPSPPSVGISRGCSSAEAMFVTGGGVGDLGDGDMVWVTSSSGGGWSSTSSLMQLSAAQEVSSAFCVTSRGSGVLSSIILGFSSNETLLSDLTLPRRLSEDRWLLRMEWVGEQFGDLWFSHWEELSLLAPDLVRSPAPESLLWRLGWPAASAVTGALGRQLFISQAGGWADAADSLLSRATADWLSSWSQTAARCRGLACPPLSVSASLLVHPSY